MELSLHANATTTPKVRADSQRSRKPVADLAAELGVSETAIRRWRGRTTVANTSHVAKTLAISLSAIEEALVCELRAKLQRCEFLRGLWLWISGFRGTPE
jgi:hypothetical protein